MPALLALAITWPSRSRCASDSLRSRSGRSAGSGARCSPIPRAIRPFTTPRSRGSTIAGFPSRGSGPSISTQDGCCGIAKQITGRANTTLSFWLITLVYVILGLLEVDDVGRKVRALDNREAARVLTDATAATADKFRKYMIVRTQMSLVTGLLVWALAWAVGLQFPVEWGVIAFVLNYIPFIGPFIATIFPTLLAMTQFSSWQAVLGIFAGLNLIQFVVGSYIEPRVSGDVLSISPFVVLFAVVFWTFLWGWYGAFIGVPIVIAILTFCEYNPASRFVADLFGGPPPAARA